MIGFIGYGNMGSMLVNKFIELKALTPKEIIVSNRTKSKLSFLKECYNDINIANNNKEVAEISDYIFICVKQPDVKEVLYEIKDKLNNKKQHIISLSGSIPIDNIEKVFPGQISKVTPTILSEINEGITLILHNDRVSDKNKDFIESLFKKISKVKRIKEEDFPIAIEITSSTPGFIACIINEYMKSIFKYNKTLNENDIKEMLIYTVYGTAKMILENKFDLEIIINRAATKGGITEEGIKVLKNYMPNIFNTVIEKTLEKRKKISEISKIL